LEETVDCSSLEDRERGGEGIKTRCDDLSFIEEAAGGCAITGHVLGDRCHGQRLRQQRELSRISSCRPCSLQRWPGSCWISLQHSQESTHEVGQGRRLRKATS